MGEHRLRRLCRSWADVLPLFWWSPPVIFWLCLLWHWWCWFLKLACAVLCCWPCLYCGFFFVCLVFLYMWIHGFQVVYAKFGLRHPNVKFRLIRVDKSLIFSAAEPWSLHVRRDTALLQVPAYSAFRGSPQSSRFRRNVAFSPHAITSAWLFLLWLPDCCSLLHVSF